MKGSAMSRQTTLLALTVAAIMSLALFMISYQVQDLETQLDSLNGDISRDQRAVHVLQAEWANLNDPERLRVLADRYLGLRPVATDQLGRIEDIPLKQVIPAADDGKAAQPKIVGKDAAETLAAVRRALGMKAKTEAEAPR